MAINARASFYFVTKDQEGWSETFFLAGATLQDCATEAAGYQAPRLACSPNNTDMIFAKVSDVAIKGDSLIVQPVSGNYPLIGTYSETPTGCFLEANTALLIEILASPLKKNRFFLRGLSLDVVTGREYLHPSGFETAITTLMTWLSTHPQVRTSNKPVTKPPVYTYAAATQAYIQGVTARRPGRPFDTLRGRKFAHRT